MDIVNIIGIVAPLVASLCGAVYYTGRWVGTINTSMKVVGVKLDAINTNLENHITHYDAELTRLREQLEDKASK